MEEIKKKNITFYHDYKSLNFSTKKIFQTIKKLEMDYPDELKKEIGVILCSDYKIRKLNKQHRNIDKATDVLTFPFNSEDFLGEIYISLQRAKIQCKKFNFTYNSEINRLFVHGFFHLLGYDHMTEAEREEMESLEYKYIF